jgi:hypothetical protein
MTKEYCEIFQLQLLCVMTECRDDPRWAALQLGTHFVNCSFRTLDSHSALIGQLLDLHSLNKGELEYNFLAPVHHLEVAIEPVHRPP